MKGQIKGVGGKERGGDDPLTGSSFPRDTFWLVRLSRRREDVLCSSHIPAFFFLFQYQFSSQPSHTVLYSHSLPLSPCQIIFSEGVKKKESHDTYLVIIYTCKVIYLQLVT